MSIGLVVLAAGAFPVAPLATTAGALASIGVLVSCRRHPPSFGLALFICFTLASVRADFALGHASIEYERARRLLSPPARCELTVEVVSSPVVRDGQTSAVVEVVEGRCREEDATALRATLGGLPADAIRGDRLRGEVEIALVQRFANEGTSSRLTRVARTGAPASGRVRRAQHLSRGDGLGAHVDRARAAVRARIEATYHPEAKALARALVLGETDLDRQVDEAFRVTGLSHLLAVSGTHLVIAVLTLASALRAILVRIEPIAQRLEAGRVAATFAIALSWLYADFAGGGGSVLRAAAMVSAASAARALGRRPSPSRCFAASLVAGTAVDPIGLLDLSFALSAAAPVGLMTLSRPIPRLLGGAPDDALGLIGATTVTPTSRVRRVWATLAGSMATTLGATIACAPIILTVSPSLPAAGVIANVIAAPLGEAFALPFALAHAVLGFAPSIEKGAALVAGGALRAVLVVARLAQATGLIVPAPPPTASEIAAGATSLVLALAARRRATRAYALSAGLVAIAALELRARAEGSPTGILRISALDVGQGDSIAIDFPDGRFMLVDAGGVPASSFDVGERVLAPVLRARRRSRVDVAVISHPHPDHYGGFVTGLRAVSLGELWDTGEVLRGDGPRGDIAKIFADAQERGARIVRPAELCGGPRYFGRVRVDVLAPCPEPSPALSTNDGSFVLRVRMGARTALLVGDLEQEGERELLERAGDSLRADLLKIGHHGSKTSTSEPLLAAVSPRFAVISCGVRNRFGHPAAGVLDALGRRGVHVARTDLGGEWRWWTDGEADGVSY